MKPLDLAGQKFNRLTAIEVVGKDKRGNYLWRCRCECGNEIAISSSKLKSGNTGSCGCLARELSSKRFTTHGMTRTKIHRKWCDIKNRCYNPKNKAYLNYGGRGIKMSDEWKNSFEQFYTDISQLEHFGEIGYTLDRINNDGDYAPDNVRFATRKQQNQNKRNNIWVEYQGETMCLKDAAERSGLPYETLHRRYYAGDRGERLFRPIRKN